MHPHLYELCDLNRCDLDEMRQHRHLLPRRLTACAEVTEGRIERYPQRFDRPDQHYAENANILLLSPFSGKGSYFFWCGFARHRCRYWRVCPYCSHITRMDILAKFLPVFFRHQWWFPTISFHGYHRIGDGESDDLASYWEACRCAFKQMVEMGIINAVYYLEEFEVISYFPVPLAQAHAHAVVAADNFNQGHIQQIIDLVRQSLRDQRQQAWQNLGPDSMAERPLLEPSTRTFGIKTEADFVRILDYLTKPIDFSKRYVAEWDKFCNDDREEVASRFNGCVDQLIAGYRVFTHRRMQHDYFGSAHHARKDFIGVPKKARQTERHRRMILSKLDELLDERMFTVIDENSNRPLELDPDCGGCVTSQARDGPTAAVQAGTLANVNKDVLAGGPGGGGSE